jgi:hypothetical protein
VIADLRTVPAPNVPFGLFVYEWAGGGRLQQVNRFPTLESLNCSCANVSDLDVARLAALRNLRTLDLSLTQVSWAIPSSLTGLNIGGTLLHDRTTDLIVEKLPQLRALGVNDTPITDAGLEDMVPMSLETLDLGMTGVTDAGLKHLGRMKELEALMLYSTAVTDRGVGELAGLARLRHLNLHVKGGIGREGLTVVCRMKELESVLVKLDAGVAEEALMGLAALPKLRKLHVTKPDLDAAQVARLQKAMPACEITWRPRD